VPQEEKKRPINRLQSMYALRALYDEISQTGLDAKKEGRPVAWSMTEPWGGPILAVMGIESIFPENYGTVCAAAGAAAPFLERAEAEGFPSHLCGYARNCLGYTAMMTDTGEIPPEAPGGGMPKPMLLVSSGAICDARFKWFQALGRYLDAPVYTLESPAPGAREGLMEGAYEHNVEFLVKGLWDFVAFLENLLGKKADLDKLTETRDDLKDMNRVWWEANDLRKARPGPMHSRDFWSSMSASFLRAQDPKAATELYRKMYDEIKYRVDNKIAGINREERYRLVFDGLPPWHSLRFFDELAERGWNFVTETYYHPGKPRDVDVSMYSDPIERYVRSRYQPYEHYLDTEFEPEEIAKIKEDIKRQGFSNMTAVRYAREYQIDGAFMHTLLTCRGTTAPLMRSQAQLMEVWKVPSLIIEGDIVDLSLFDPADALRKAEAFEETMDHYKRVRKEEGLEW